MTGVIEEILAAFVYTLLASAAGLVYFKVRRLVRAARVPVEPDQVEEVSPEAVEGLPLDVDSGTPLRGKLALLEARHADAVARAARIRPDDRDAGDAARREADALESALRNMRFLSPHDLLDDQFELLELIGEGRVSQVWKAVDVRESRFVAIKFLRPSLAGDSLVRDRFYRGARTMNEIRSGAVPGVLAAGFHAGVATGGDRLSFYVMDYVDGRCLDQYLIEEVPRLQTLGATVEFKERLIRGLIDLGECVTEAHAGGVLHRDIKPTNIVVTPGGSLKLVDFDSVARVVDCRRPHRDVGTVGFSAPEVLGGSRPHDIRADVFSLSRVMLCVYYGRPLPDPYEMSTLDLIDGIDCDADIKDVLRRATSVRPEARHASMPEFLADLSQALDRGTRRFSLSDVVRHFRAERHKLYITLRHACYGTLAAMLIARPLLVLPAVLGFTDVPLVFLSDKLPVAAFHAVIGSVVWGVLITGAFLWYASVLHREDRLGYLSAMLACGAGGFLGGVLCALPGAMVTNPAALHEFGWTVQAHGGNLDALADAAVRTRMFWAFPWIGLFTGMGTGLALNLRVNQMLRRGVPRLVPFPVKRIRTGDHAAMRSMAFVLSSPATHALLLLPVAGGLLAPLVLSPAGIALPDLLLQSAGEGLVQYLGALGLAIGFFFGAADDDWFR